MLIEICVYELSAAISIKRVLTELYCIKTFTTSVYNSVNTRLKNGISGIMIIYLLLNYGNKKSKKASYCLHTMKIN